MKIISNIAENNEKNRLNQEWLNFLTENKLYYDGICIYKKSNWKATQRVMKIQNSRKWNGYGPLEELCKIVQKYEECNPGADITLIHESETYKNVR